MIQSSKKNNYPHELVTIILLCISLIAVQEINDISNIPENFKQT